MNTSSDRFGNRFAATRWSIVMQCVSGDARGALDDLARRYWYPIYTYLRLCGHLPEAAAEIAQAFLQQLPVAAQNRTGASAYQGQFRSFLLERLRAYLAMRRTEPVAVAAAADVTAEVEARYRHDQLDALTPEQGYQRAYALQVLQRTLRRLRDEARQTGHLAMHEALEPFLARDPRAGEYEAAATALRVRPVVLQMALRRLRLRYGELAAEELADTVASSDELAAEQGALLAALGAGTTP